MAASIRAIETAVPGTVMDQEALRDVFLVQPGVSRLGQRLTSAAFDGSAIATRHTAIAELSGHEPGDNPVFYDAGTGAILTPGTGARNDAYVRLAPDLFETAARRAIDAADGIEAADVTHVVTVSCTGFYAPGPDYQLVRRLGLAPSARRLHLGFMGCYGAFPGLSAAEAYCAAEPDAVVLVVCAELCSLHLRASNEPDTIVASSVFADGAAAAIVSARPAPAGARVLDIAALETVLTPVGEDSMAWTIGDQGFDMILSSYVPHIVEEHIRSALVPLFARVDDAGPVPGGDAHDGGAAPGGGAGTATSGEPGGGIERWAVHPGGRSILDRVQSELRLSDEQLAPSRDVLRDFGNMSSATILFVLAELLHGGASDGERVCAMAFGPGLTVETGLFLLRVGA